MPILRADVKELAGNRHADIDHLLQLLPEALSGAKAGSTMRRYAPLWRYFRDWCTGHDLQFLPAAPLTAVLAEAGADGKLLLDDQAGFRSHRSIPQLCVAD